MMNLDEVRSSCPMHRVLRLQLNRRTRNDPLATETADKTDALMDRPYLVVILAE